MTQLALLQSVPARVRATYAQLLEKAAAVRQAAGTLTGEIHCTQDGQACYIEKAAQPELLRMRLAPLFDTVQCVPELPSRVSPELVTIKTSASNPLSTLGNFYRMPAEYLGKMMGSGGATPLTSALTSGAINAALGYGAGHLYNNILAKPLARFFPDKFSGETLAPEVLALLGGTSGALLNLPWGVSAAQAKQKSGQPLGVRDYLGMSNYGYGKQASALGPFGVANARLQEYPLDPEYTEAVQYCVYGQEPGEKWADAGGLFSPSIPVDAFNNVIWAPWQENNPFGTKSSFGDNDQPLRAPNWTPQSAAALSGLAAAASASRGGATHIAPADVARVAGYGAAGWAAGRLFAGLTGMKPAARDKITQMGLLGGLVRGTAKHLGLL